MEVIKYSYKTEYNGSRYKPPDKFVSKRKSFYIADRQYLDLDVGLVRKIIDLKCKWSLIFLVGSTHNGVMNGRRYFHCARGHGALVPYTDVRKINPAETQPPVTGNFMFEGYAEVVKQRTLRRQKMEYV